MMNDPSAPRGFEIRHIGPSPQDVSAMLETIGVSSLDELIAQTIPDDIRQHAPLDLGAALSETEALEKARQLAARNLVLTSLIGQGYYGTILPSVIQRNILENPAWYTAYTPYQPEISQGRLEALLNFQTMIADLTALDIANASLLDEATAAASSIPRRWPWRNGFRSRRARSFSPTGIAIPRRSLSCRPAPKRWAGRSSSATPCKTSILRRFLAPCSNTPARSAMSAIFASRSRG